jgi:hypothetical protein
VLGGVIAVVVDGATMCGAGGGRRAHNLPVVSKSNEKIVIEKKKNVPKVQLETPRVSSPLLLLLLPAATAVALSCRYRFSCHHHCIATAAGARCRRSSTVVHLMLAPYT